MTHEPLVTEHIKNFRDIAVDITSIKERVSVIETNQDNFESRISARDEEIKAIAGLVFEIRQMRLDFNKVSDIVVDHGARLDNLQNKPGVLAISVLIFLAGIVATKMFDLMFTLL